MTSIWRETEKVGIIYRGNEKEKYMVELSKLVNRTGKINLTLFFTIFPDTKNPQRRNAQWNWVSKSKLIKSIADHVFSLWKTLFWDITEIRKIEGIKKIQKFLYSRNTCRILTMYNLKKTYLPYTGWETHKTFLLFTEPVFDAFGDCLVSLIMHWQPSEVKGRCLGRTEMREKCWWLSSPCQCFEECSHQHLSKTLANAGLWWVVEFGKRKDELVRHQRQDLNVW